MNTCFHCGKAATRLCDFVIGYQFAGTRVIRGMRSDYTSIELPPFTCDIPLCGTCTTAGTPEFLCGDFGCDVDHDDYCRIHAQAQQTWLDNRCMSAADAEKRRQQMRRQWNKQQRQHGAAAYARQVWSIQEEEQQ